MLSALSRSLFEAPPPGFTEMPLMSCRAVAFLVLPSQQAELAMMLAEGKGVREIAVADLSRRVPALRPDHAVAAAVEEDAFDMDVAALHQGFLKQLHGRGGTLAAQG
jgi:D-arginine dehydrogenase